MSRTRKAKRTRGKNSDKQQSRCRTPKPKTNVEQLRSLLEWLLPCDGIFAGLKLHGNTRWLPRCLVCLAVCWAWAETRNVTDAFTHAVEWCRVMGHGAVPATYQGFIRALVRWTDSLIPILWRVIHQRMKQIAGSFWKIRGWVPIAFDGSRSTAPRSESNEKAFCAENYGNGKTAKYRKKKTKGMRRRKNEKNKPQAQQPQAWITLMWHMALRLPWAWRLGPSNSSERAHVMQMLDDEEFSENTLFCGDAGFVGYPLWERIILRGYNFLVRVGANVQLLSESADFQIQNDGRVLCWPKAAMESGKPPLELRLVRVKIGKTQVWILTSVLSPSELSKKDIVRLYKKRWGIEVEFRGLKQTLDRAKLRCRDSRRLLAELNWSLMAMTLAELFALKEQLAPSGSGLSSDEPPGNPEKRSLANTMRALRHALSHLSEVPERGHHLPHGLRHAVTDSYKRKSSKRARYRPPNPDKKPLGDPKIRKLTIPEKKKLDALNAEKLAV